jgi:hypothetical protein
MAMVWLIDDDGSVRAPYVDDYEVVGRDDRRSRRQDADHDDAFANLAPAT